MPPWFPNGQHTQSLALGLALFGMLLQSRLNQDCRWLFCCAFFQLQPFFYFISAGSSREMRDKSSESVSLRCVSSCFFCNGSIQVVTGPVVSSEDALSSLLLYCALLRYFFLLSVLLSSTPRRRRAFRAPPPTGVRGVARASAACSTLHTAT